MTRRREGHQVSAWWAFILCSCGLPPTGRAEGYSTSNFRVAGNSGLIGNIVLSRLVTSTKHCSLSCMLFFACASTVRSMILRRKRCSRRVCLLAASGMLLLFSLPGLVCSASAQTDPIAQALAGMKDSSKDVRIHAIEQLGQSQDPRAAPATPPEPTPRASASALGRGLPRRRTPPR
jgi:hypothetical protein